jgi:hypothetical protein
MQYDKCSGNVSSEPAYLANGSNDTSIHGAGFVVSLALLLNYRELFWQSKQCNVELVVAVQPFDHIAVQVRIFANYRSFARELAPCPYC